jgi:heat shock protein HslJ
MKNILILFLAIHIFSSCSKNDLYLVRKIDPCEANGCYKVAEVEKKSTIVPEWTTVNTIEGLNLDKGQVLKAKLKSLENNNKSFSLVDKIESIPDDLGLLNGKWNLTNMPGQENFGKYPKITLSFSKGTWNFSGNGGCNSFNGELVPGSANEITFRNVVATERQCNEPDLESAFFTKLAQVRSFELEGSGLNLYGSDKELILDFQRSRMKKRIGNKNGHRINQPGGMASIHTLHGSWMVESVMGQKINAGMDGSSLKPKLDFDFMKNRISGNDGCNSIGASYFTDEKNGITIGPMMGTKRMCNDMTVPNMVNEALGKAKSFTKSNNELRLLDSTGKVLMVLRNG